MTTKNKRIHTALIGSASAHKKYSMQAFQSLGLSTGQPKVLSILYENEGYLQKDLAMKCHVEPATMTSLLNNMLDKGLIYKNREIVSGGKRAYSVHLTDKGRGMASKVNDIVIDVETICFQGFLESEKQLLIELLNRLQTNLDHA